MEKSIHAEDSREGICGAMHMIKIKVKIKGNDDCLKRGHQEALERRGVHSLWLNSLETVWMWLVTRHITFYSSIKLLFSTVTKGLSCDS